MATLTNYINQTRRLLQLPSATNSLYTTADLTVYVNTARVQVAGEGACIRAEGTVDTVVGTRSFAFSGLNFGVSATTGISGALNVRQLFYGVGTGRQWITPRGWEWFSFYNLNTPVPQSGAPSVWSQLGQGVNGTIYVDPLPDLAYTLTADAVCYPIDLVDDTTVDAIPALWTDAVSYFAAYLTLLSAQNAARQEDANRMFERYEAFVERARTFSTPTVVMEQYPQTPDPAIGNRLGVMAAPRQGG